VAAPVRLAAPVRRHQHPELSAQPSQKPPVTWRVRIFLTGIKRLSQLDDTSPAVRQARRTIARIDGGETLTVPTPPRARWPQLASVPWFVERLASRVTVDADDRVRPVYHAN